MVQIIIFLGDNGNHPAPVILVFRNRPILVHNNKKYDCSGVARVRSHCMAPIPACAGMTIRAHRGATSQTWIPGRGPGITHTKTSATG